MGLRFDACNGIGLSFTFDNCTLDHSSFYQLKIKRSVFKNTGFKEADFSETDISESVFLNCDLAGAVFDNTNLEKSDLRTSYNYSIDPENNRIKRAKFSFPGVMGLLDKYGIIMDNS